MGSVPEYTWLALYQGNRAVKGILLAWYFPSNLAQLICIMEDNMLKCNWINKKLKLTVIVFSISFDYLTKVVLEDLLRSVWETAVKSTEIKKLI